MGRRAKSSKSMIASVSRLIGGPRSRFQADIDTILRAVGTLDNDVWATTREKPTVRGKELLALPGLLPSGDDFLRL